MSSVAMSSTGYAPRLSTISSGSTACGGDQSLDSLYPSSSLLSFVKRRVAQVEAYHGQEKRSELRCLLVMPVVVQAVDEHIQPVGEAQAMVICDVSPTGLGLVHEHPFHHSRVVVHLSYPEDGKLLAVEVRWSKPLGPFYHIGCQVIGPFTLTGGGKLAADRA
jgi:hypothetical protein